MKFSSLKWIILSLLALAAAAAVIIISVSAGACTGSIETTDGGQVPMKCHWTQRIIEISAVLPLVITIIQLFLKEISGRRACALILLVSVVLMLILTTNVGIGVCAAENMACGKMVLLVRIDLGLLALIALAQIFCASDKRSRPKRGF